MKKKMPKNPAPETQYRTGYDDDLLKKDEFGLYVNATNYQEVRSNTIQGQKRNDLEKLNRIPYLIRLIFNAI